MKCMIYTHRTAEEPKNVRRLVIDGREYRFEGRNDEAGIFRADIHGPEDIVTMPDMMHLLIRDFAAGQADVTAADAVDNLAWMLRPMGHPRPGREDAPPADDTTG